MGGALSRGWRGANPGLRCSPPAAWGARAGPRRANGIGRGCRVFPTPRKTLLSGVVDNPPSRRQRRRTTQPGVGAAPTPGAARQGWSSLKGMHTGTPPRRAAAFGKVAGRARARKGRAGLRPAGTSRVRPDGVKTRLAENNACFSKHLEAGRACGKRQLADSLPHSTAVGVSTPGFGARPSGGKGAGGKPFRRRRPAPGGPGRGPRASRRGTRRWRSALPGGPSTAGSGRCSGAGRGACGSRRRRP